MSCCRIFFRSWLRDAGVSIWLDALSRDLLETGEFKTLVDEFAVSGATSNPTIFAKAIGGWAASVRGGTTVDRLL
jgi:transaldolase